MNTKHTPGPWIYDAEAQCVVIEDRKKLHTCAEIDLSEVAHGGASFEEAVANARLIAAAPELLAALEWAAEFIPESKCNCRETVRAAIAKARGD